MYRIFLTEKDTSNIHQLLSNPLFPERNLSRLSILSTPIYNSIYTWVQKDPFFGEMAFRCVMDLGFCADEALITENHLSKKQVYI